MEGNHALDEVASLVPDIRERCPTALRNEYRRIIRRNRELLATRSALAMTLLRRMVRPIPATGVSSAEEKAYLEHWLPILMTALKSLDVTLETPETMAKCGTFWDQAKGHGCGPFVTVEDLTHQELSSASYLDAIHNGAECHGEDERADCQGKQSRVEEIVPHSRVQRSGSSSRSNIELQNRNQDDEIIGDDEDVHVGREEEDEDVIVLNTTNVVNEDDAVIQRDPSSPSDASNTQQAESSISTGKEVSSMSSEKCQDSTIQLVKATESQQMSKTSSENDSSVTDEVEGGSIQQNDLSIPDQQSSDSSTSLLPTVEVHESTSITEANQVTPSTSANLDAQQNEMTVLEEESSSSSATSLGQSSADSSTPLSPTIEVHESTSVTEAIPTTSRTPANLTAGPLISGKKSQNCDQQTRRKARGDRARKTNVNANSRGGKAAAKRKVRGKKAVPQTFEESHEEPDETALATPDVGRNEMGKNDLEHEHEEVTLFSDDEEDEDLSLQSHPKRARMEKNGGDKAKDEKMQFCRDNNVADVLQRFGRIVKGRESVIKKQRVIYNLPNMRNVTWQSEVLMATSSTTEAGAMQSYGIFGTSIRATDHKNGAKLNFFESLSKEDAEFIRTLRMFGESHRTWLKRLEDLNIIDSLVGEVRVYPLDSKHLDMNVFRKSISYSVFPPRMIKRNKNDGKGNVNSKENEERADRWPFVICYVNSAASEDNRLSTNAAAVINNYKSLSTLHVPPNSLENWPETECERCKELVEDAITTIAKGDKSSNDVAKNLRDHYRSTHSEPEEMYSYKCLLPGCTKVDTEPGKMRDHMLLHCNLVCEECPEEVFSYTSQLTQHMLEKHGKEVCNGCELALIDGSSKMKLCESCAENLWTSNDDEDDYDD